MWRARPEPYGAVIEPEPNRGDRRDRLMNTEIRLHLANERIREGHRQAADERLAAMATDRDLAPPRGPLGWFGRTAGAIAGATVHRLKGATAAR
jgi:hypothetical protein